LRLGNAARPDADAAGDRGCIVGALTIRVLGIWRAGRFRTRFPASGANRPRRGGAPASGTPEIKREGIPMSDFDRNYATATRGVGAGRAAAIDAGLRAYMIRAYNYMAMGAGLP